MEQKKNNTIELDGVVSFLELLFLLLLGLKLADIISWSWWWVCAPIWVPLAIFILIIVGVFLYSFIKELREGKDE